MCLFFPSMSHLVFHTHPDSSVHQCCTTCKFRLHIFERHDLHVSQDCSLSDVSNDRRPMEGRKNDRKSNRSSDNYANKKAKQDREELRAELCAVARGPKHSIAATLRTLQARGYLTDSELGGADEHRQLTSAAHKHANARTPYGDVVQIAPIEMNDGSIYNWEIINPFAFLWCSGARHKKQQKVA